MSARIGAGQAVKAAHALTEAGWTTADNLAATSWRERVRVLNRHGYARYDERTTSMLGDACELLLLDRYRGDLRRLRTEAGQDRTRGRSGGHIMDTPTSGGLCGAARWHDQHRLPPPVTDFGTGPCPWPPAAP